MTFKNRSCPARLTIDCTVREAEKAQSSQSGGSGHLFSLLLPFYCFFILSCGTEKKDEPETNQNTDTRYSVAAATVAELPACNESRVQALAYVFNEDNLYACDGQNWVAVPLPKGDKGDVGAPGANGAAGPKGDPGAAGAAGEDGSNGGSAVVAVTECTQSLTSPAGTPPKTYDVTFRRDYYDTGSVRSTFNVEYQGTAVHTFVTLGDKSGDQPSGCLTGICHFVELEADEYSLVVTTKVGESTDKVYHRQLISNTYWTIETLMNCTTSVP